MADFDDLVLPSTQPVEKGQGHIDDHKRIASWLLRTGDVVGSVRADLATVGSRAQQAASAAATATANVEALGSAFGTLRTDVTGLSGRVGDLRTDVGALQRVLPARAPLPGQVLSADDTGTIDWNTVTSGDFSGPWSPVRPYKAGEYVTYGGGLFQARVDMAPAATTDAPLYNPLTETLAPLSLVPGGTTTAPTFSTAGVNFNVATTLGPTGIQTAQVVPDVNRTSPNGWQVSVRIARTATTGTSWLTLGAPIIGHNNTSPYSANGTHIWLVQTNGQTWSLARYLTTGTNPTSSGYGSGTLATPFTGGYADVTLAMSPAGGLSLTFAVNGGVPVTVTTLDTTTLGMNYGTAGIGYGIRSHTTGGVDTFSAFRLSSAFASPQFQAPSWTRLTYGAVQGMQLANNHLYATLVDGSVVDAGEFSSAVGGTWRGQYDPLGSYTAGDALAHDKSLYRARADYVPVLDVNETMTTAPVGFVRSGTWTFDASGASPAASYTTLLRNFPTRESYLGVTQRVRFTFRGTTTYGAGANALLFMGGRALRVVATAAGAASVQVLAAATPAPGTNHGLTQQAVPLASIALSALGTSYYLDLSVGIGRDGAFLATCSANGGAVQTVMSDTFRPADVNTGIVLGLGGPSSYLAYNFSAYRASFDATPTPTPAFFEPIVYGLPATTPTAPGQVLKSRSATYGDFYWDTITTAGVVGASDWQNAFTAPAAGTSLASGLSFTFTATAGQSVEIDMKMPINATAAGTVTATATTGAAVNLAAVSWLGASPAARQSAHAGATSNVLFTGSLAASDQLIQAQGFLTSATTQSVTVTFSALAGATIRPGGYFRVRGLPAA